MHSPKFSIILKAIKIVYSRHPSKRAATYSWTLDLFNKHLREFHKFPEGLKRSFNEGQESFLLENDTRVRSILDYLREVIDFYVPIVKEFSIQRDSGSMDESVLVELGKQERVLKSCLVDLLGRPLIYFDLSCSNGKDLEGLQRSRSRLQWKKPMATTVKFQSRLIVEEVMKLLAQVNRDSSFFMKWAEQKCCRQPPLADVDEVEYDEEVEEVSIQELALGNYFYLVYAEQLSPSEMPMTYTTAHLFRVQLPLVMTILNDREQSYLSVQKGLLLAQKLIVQMSERFSSEYVTEKAYSTFIEKLTEIIIYSESKPTRQLALSVLNSYFWGFDSAGKYMFFQFIHVKVQHAGLVGFMIGQMKECIDSALKEDVNSQKELRLYFLGDNLAKLLLQFCVLKDGVTTDLIEVSDHVIAVLNLLRFLLLRDGAENKSGILNVTPQIELLMLRPLRSALDLTKAHYNLKLKEVMDPEYRQHEMMAEGDLAPEFAANAIIEGKEVKMEDVPLDEQIKILKSGLLSMDMMESLLARVNECYSSLMRSK